MCTHKHDFSTEGVYMRIEYLSVQNFRGIRCANIDFSKIGRAICIIGAGDSTKSTILNAIWYALYPSYGLYLNDSDFYNNSIESPIVIEITVSEICDDLLVEDKFGLCIRGNILEQDDEPKADDLPKLTIRLSIDKTLEPKWEVVCNRKEPKIISHLDRRRLSVGMIGASYSNDLTWSRNSVLNRFCDAKAATREIIATAQRAAAEGAVIPEDMHAATIAITEAAKTYGVLLSNEIKSQLMYGATYSAGSIGIFDGTTPLVMKGLGSQRLLSIGLNAASDASSSLILIDEIESGLEPYRLCSLINTLKLKKCSVGQIIFSTHSSVAVATCDAKELMIVRSQDGVTEALVPIFDNSRLDNDIQAFIRKRPEAMLSRRIIVCEGKTEYGFMYAIDDFLESNNLPRFVGCGVSWVYGEGSCQYDIAKTLNFLGFQVAVFCDSDRPEDAVKIEQLKAAGICFFQWEVGQSIETQIFQDSNLHTTNELILAMIRSERISSSAAYVRVCEGVFSILFPTQVYDSTIPLTVTNAIAGANDKIAIMAKANSWIKNITAGREFGHVVMRNISKFDQQSGTRKLLRNMWKWVKKYD
jgi:ABC-type cobalamin/Fe3+-siderophores transport system ATPase subunit